MVGRGWIAVGLLALCGVSAGAQAGRSQAGAQTELQRHIELAQRYLAQREPAKAIPELQAVVAMDPQNFEARANLGVLLFFQGEFAAALPELRATVEAKPELTKIRALLGIAERRTGDDRAGRADLEAAFPAIAEEKLKLDVGRDLIDSYTASDELERAAAMTASLLVVKPADPGLLYTSYRLHHDLAVQALLELSIAAPESGQMHQAMAHELERDHDLPGVIRNLRQALAADATLPGIHFELAEALHASDDQRLRAESFEQYKLALQNSPGDAKAASRLGDVEVEQGDLAAADKDYQQALAAHPDYADAKIGLANVLMQRGDTEAARKLLEEVVAVDPTNSLAHYRLSAVYRKLKRPEDVKTQLALYERYKAEREKLKALYQTMRVAAPAGAEAAK